MVAKTALMAVLAACTMLAAHTVKAEEYKLPDAAEVAGFSRDAMRFYMAGIEAFDRIDHVNAYSNFVKAAQLQPEAVQLNLITAAVAMKFGRAKGAPEARAYYDTAIVAYRNVLRHQELSDRFLRDVQNKLRVAVEEQDQLTVRDNKREALGSAFVMAHNEEIAEPTPNPTPKVAQPAVVVPAGVTVPTAVNPYAAQPGVYAPGVNPYAVPVAPAYPGAMAPGAPGAYPGQQQQGPPQYGMPEGGQPLI